MTKEIKWRFGVVGNITKTHMDGEGNVFYGTKAFKPGAKVYIDGKYWDNEKNHISVIGRNRFGRIALENVPIDTVENFRTQRIYSPKVLEIMNSVEVIDGWIWWGNSVKDKKETKDFVRRMEGKNGKLD